MNLELLAVEQEWPDSITETLFLPRLSPACCAFNRRGNYLALGGNEGQLAVWDLEATRSAARILRPHHGARVNSVSWSSDGKWLLSASADHKVTIWDLLTAKRVRTFRFPGPVTSAQFHPRRNDVLLVCVATYVPCVIAFDTIAGWVRTFPIMLEPDGLSNGSLSNPGDAVGSASMETLIANPSIAGSNDNVEDKPTNGAEDAWMPELDNTHVDYLTDEHSAPEMGVYVGCFSHDGEKLFFGSAKGMLSVVVLRTRHVAFQARVVDLKASVKEVAISRRGRFVLINTTDRQIRAMPIDHITGLPLTHYTVRYKNTVEQCQWDACCFSPDEDYVVGGRKGTQELYIWDRLTGNLKRKLEGPQEGVSIVNIAWHPHRPIIAMVSQEDRVYIWANNTEENWSAFAPDFREVAENTEYREMEDEFDIVADDALTRQKIHGLAEPLEESPDIMTVPSVPVLEDEFDNTLPTPSGENSRKRRKISSWLCDLPPIERYASEAEESEGADSDDDKSKNNQGR